MTGDLQVAVIGGGPIGLTTALGLAHYGVPVEVFEDDAALSLDTKAGTILTRTLEVFDRYGVVDSVLAASVRLDEIGEIDRATNVSTGGVRTHLLTEDTRYPFVINIPQHHLEPILRDELDARAPGALHMSHRLVDFRQEDDHVVLVLETPDGRVERACRYLLACDGGRSFVRERLGIAVEGMTLEERYMLVDLQVDLDVAHPRDYPHLAYFGDPTEWMILVRQPHCWRFLFPLPPGAPEPTGEEMAQRARRFIGDISDITVLGSNVYSVHHRVAQSWQDGRIFLMGDAAHLITPMWALGLNTGVLDASNLPWRIAFVLRGWADEGLLDGYAREQAPVAIQGSGEMAEAARANMARKRGIVEAMQGGDWGVAMTRGLLGVRLDVDNEGDWSMVVHGQDPAPVRVGDRIPDLPLFTQEGRQYLHDLADGRFVGLWFTDVRRHPRIPTTTHQGLVHLAVSRYDAPRDSGLRDRFAFDPGARVQERLQVPVDTCVLVRPDGHIAYLGPFDPTTGEDPLTAAFLRITRPAPSAASAGGPA